MHLSKEEINSLKPKEKGKNDKYLWNLYRFLVQNKKQNIRVYYGESNQYGKGYKEYFFAVTECGKGYDNIGIFYHTLNSARPYGALNMMSFVHIDFKDFEDVTEKFFKEYSEKGRCLIYPDHTKDTFGLSERLEDIDSNHKHCKWCGKNFKRKTKEIIVQKEVLEEID